MVCIIITYGNIHIYKVILGTRRDRTFIYNVEEFHAHIVYTLCCYFLIYTRQWKGNIKIGTGKKIQE